MSSPAIVLCIIVLHHDTPKPFNPVRTKRAQLIVVWAGLWGGKQLHDDMIFHLFKAPMAFFNATPIGRIINRVARDVSGVDKVCGECGLWYIYIGVSTRCVVYVGCGI